jgi:Na+/H+-dicarboxylate symporter
MRAAPFYVAAGVPIEGYLLTEAVETIPDIFKTLVNVTGDMTAAAIVNRFTNATDRVRTPTPLRVEELTGGGV